MSESPLPARGDDAGKRDKYSRDTSPLRKDRALPSSWARNGKDKPVYNDRFRDRNGKSAYWRDSRRDYDRQTQRHDDRRRYAEKSDLNRSHRPGHSSRGNDWRDGGQIPSRREDQHGETYKADRRRDTGGSSRAQPDHWRDEDDIEARSVPRSERERSHARRDEALYEIKRLEKTPESEDDEARERRLKRLKRRRRSAGLSTSSEEEEEDFHAVRRNKDRKRDVEPTFESANRREGHSERKAFRRITELERRLSRKNESDEDDSRGASSSRRQHDRISRDRDYIRDRPHREVDRSSPSYDRRSRRDSPDFYKRNGVDTRNLKRQTASTSSDEDAEWRRRRSPAAGIRIAGSSARRNEGDDAQKSKSNRSPSPKIRLLRRRRSVSPVDSPRDSTVESRNGVKLLAQTSGDGQEIEAANGAHDASHTVSRAARGRPDETYERIAQVGEGTYGQVFKAKSDRTGVIVALKRIRMESERDGFPITAMREIKLLQGLRHENVVMLHEIMLSKTSVYMVFEYLQHDLNGVLSHNSIAFSPANLKSLAAQLLSGLAYLHQHSILHRDLKCSNLLLSSDGTLKLADFGLARMFTKRARLSQHRSLDYTNRVVTLWYRAPELLFGETNYDDAIDVWGAGCIFLELFTRKPVFPGNDEIHQVQLLFETLGPITHAAWPEASELPWYDLVRPNLSAREGHDQGTDSRPLRRLFASQVPADALDVVEALLTYSPHRRLSARDALSLPYFAVNDPAAQRPSDALQAVEGEWHEFESRRAKRDAAAQALHARVHQERTTLEEGQAKRQSHPQSLNHTNSTQATPDTRTSRYTDRVMTDQHDESGNASA